MDVATITMPADLARQKYDEYRAALAGREPTDEDRGIVLGYRALAKGRAILDLHQIFRACPLDEQHRPKLAVARAAWRWAYFYRYRFDGGDGMFTQYDLNRTRGRLAWHRKIRIPGGDLPAGCLHQQTLRAMVPMVPPNLRPAKALHHYLILWEADWREVPTDPMLLHHLHGSLYAVLAVWDLTELERAVLAGRLTGQPQ